MLNNEDTKAVAKRVSELNLAWEKITDKVIYRAETANFIIAADFTNYEDSYLYITTKSTGITNKMKYSMGNKELLEISSQAQVQSNAKDNSWVKDFLKDEKLKKETPVPQDLLPADDLMGYSRSA